MLAPVIKLAPLTYEELLVLTEKLMDVHSQLFEYIPSFTQNDLISFIKIEYERVGADTHITPREVIRDFIEILDIMYQNPSVSLCQLLNSDAFSYSIPQISEEAIHIEFAEFEV